MNIELTDGVVTLLVRHRIKQGQDQAYETWLRQIIAKARSYPGHLGIDVVRGHSGGLGLFTSVLRFASTEQLQHWLDSADRRELVQQAQHLLADGDQTESTPIANSGLPLRTAAHRPRHRAGNRRV